MSINTFDYELKNNQTTQSYSTNRSDSLTPTQLLELQQIALNTPNNSTSSSRNDISATPYSLSTLTRSSSSIFTATPDGSATPLTMLKTPSISNLVQLNDSISEDPDNISTIDSIGNPIRMSRQLSDIVEETPPQKFTYQSPIRTTKTFGFKNFLASEEEDDAIPLLTTNCKIKTDETPYPFSLCKNALFQEIVDNFNNPSIDSPADNLLAGRISKQSLNAPFFIYRPVAIFNEEDSTITSLNSEIFFSQEFIQKVSDRERLGGDIIVENKKIHEVDGKIVIYEPIALFKPQPMENRGLTSSSKDSSLNEETSVNLSSLIQPGIVPHAERVALKIDLITGNPEDPSYAQSMPYLEGTLHVFLNDARELKKSEADRNQFYSASNSSSQKRTRAIAALHILTMYLDGHQGNLMLDKEGSPHAIDFGEILSPKFEIGARPPFWLPCKATQDCFTQEETAAIRSINWDDITPHLEGYSDEKIKTFGWAYKLLQKGVEKGLTPNEIECFLIGHQLMGLGTYRQPAAMNVVYEANSEALLDLGIEYLRNKEYLKDMPPLSPSATEQQTLDYHEQIAVRLRAKLIALTEESDPMDLSSSSAES